MENKYNNTEDYIKRLGHHLPIFNEFMNDIKNKISPFIIDFLRVQSKDISNMNKILDFKLKLVIDNNILFSVINGLIKGSKKIESSLFYNLANNEIADFYAPPFLKEEIFEKIDQKIDLNKKKKAYDYAQILLDKIKIKEAFWVSDWIKASKTIGHKDQDDIPYLALYFDLNGHGIMSNDDVFLKYQNDAKTWSLNDTSKIISQFDKGIISIFCIGNIPNFVTYIGEILNCFVISIFDIIKDLLNIFTGVLKEGIVFLSKLPSELFILFGGIIFTAYLYSKDFKQKVNDIFQYITKYIKEVIQRLKEWLTKLYNFLINLYSLLKNFTIQVSKVFLYMLLNSNLIIEKIAEIENNK